MEIAARFTVRRVSERASAHLMLSPRARAPHLRPPEGIVALSYANGSQRRGRALLVISRSHELILFA